MDSDATLLAANSKILGAFYTDSQVADFLVWWPRLSEVASPWERSSRRRAGALQGAQIYMRSAISPQLAVHPRGLHRGETVWIASGVDLPQAREVIGVAERPSSREIEEG